MEFQSSVNEVDEVTREVVVSIGASELSRTVSERLAKLQRTVSIKGFRAGKAPLALVTKLHAEGEKDRAINTLINETLSSVIRDSNLKTCGEPNVTVQSKGDGETNLEYTAQVFLYPTIEIDLDTPFEIEIEQIPSVDEAVEEAIKGFLRRHVVFQPISDSRDVLQHGDGVVISVRPKVDSAVETAENQTEEKAQQSVAEETFIYGNKEIPEDLENQFAGKRVGEIFELETKASEENSDAEPKKNTEPKKLIVEIKKITQPVFPELTDEWVRQLNEGIESVEELKNGFRERSVFLRDKASGNSIDAKLLEQINARASFKIPEFMIYDTIASSHFKKGVDHYWVSVKQMVQGLPEDLRNQTVADAHRRVKNSLILSEISRILEVELTEEAFKEYVSRSLEEFKFGIRTFNQQESERFSNPEQMKIEARSSLIFEKLRLKANVREVAA